MQPNVRSFYGVLFALPVGNDAANLHLESLACNPNGNQFFYDPYFEHYNQPEKRRWKPVRHTLFKVSRHHHIPTKYKSGSRRSVWNLKDYVQVSARIHHQRRLEIPLQFVGDCANSRQSRKRL